MSGFTAHAKELILSRSGGNCEVMAKGCGYTATDIHHRRPRGMGGTTRPDSNIVSNGIAVCRHCHMWCESERNWARDNGFLVRLDADPAGSPIWWRCGRNVDGVKLWRLLLDNGEMQILGNEDTGVLLW